MRGGESQQGGEGTSLRGGGRDGEREKGKIDANDEAE